MMNRLGGTLKIAQVLSVLDTDASQDVIRGTSHDKIFPSL